MPALEESNVHVLAFIHEQAMRSSKRDRVAFSNLMTRYLRVFIESYLYIKPRKKPPQRFTLNNIQRRALARFCYDTYVRRVPVRWIWLKARRMGVTTLVCAIMHAIVRLNRSHTGLIIANDGGTSEMIFRMHKLFNEYLNNSVVDGSPIFAMPSKASSTKMLRWYDYVPEHDLASKIGGDYLKGLLPESLMHQKNANRYGFAEEGGSIINLKSGLSSKGVIGDDIHCLHYSEIGDDKPQWRGLAGSTDQNVPDMVGTFIIREGTTHMEDTSRKTTATYLYNEWQRAQDYPAKDGGFSRVFDGWWEYDAYRLPLQQGEDIAPCGDTDKERVSDEKELLRLRELITRSWDITNQKPDREKDLTRQMFEALKWRQTVGIPKLCNRDLQLFHSQYPSFPDEAFVVRTTGYFDSIEINIRLEETERVEKERAAANDPYPRDEALREGMSKTLRIIHPPNHDDMYIMGCDPSYGKSGGDPSAAVVFNASKFRVEAVWQSEYDETGQAEEWQLLGWMYSTIYINEATGRPEREDPALAVIEANTIGSVIIQAMRDKHYPRIYKRQHKRGGSDPSDQYGFYTTGADRDKAISALKRHAFTWQMMDRRIWTQMAKFGFNNSGKLEGLRGHDELVMCLSFIAYVCHQLRLFPDPATPRVGTTTEAYERTNTLDSQLINLNTKFNEAIAESNAGGIDAMRKVEIIRKELISLRSRKLHGRDGDERNRASNMMVTGRVPVATVSTKTDWRVFV